MSFRSVNEIHQFSFEDCTAAKLELSGSPFRLTLEALRVLPQNSQNTNYTESYAGTTLLSLTDCELLSAAKEGYRYYNANGVLLSEIPDLPLPVSDTKFLEKTLEGSYLFAIEKDAEGPTERQIYRFRFELPKEDIYDTTPTESYELLIAFHDAVFSWDFYMNRVQN